ncbi:MAG: hypothetical protein RL328_2415 [Acidobacteriota bacterium]
MKDIRDVQGELRWVQTSALKRDYELRADQELVAQLRFRSLMGSFAEAENSLGRWTFKRVGFLHPRVTIRASATDADIATFRNNTWSGGGTLTLSDGRTFLATTNCWHSSLEIQTEPGEVLVRLQTTGIWQNCATVSITSHGLEIPELPWITLFAWYVIVMMQVDNAWLGSAAAMAP